MSGDARSLLGDCVAMRQGALCVRVGVFDSLTHLLRTAGQRVTKLAADIGSAAATLGTACERSRWTKRVTDGSAHTPPPITPSGKIPLRKIELAENAVERT